MKNKYLKSIVVLFSICLIVAVLMAFINSLTAPIIADAEVKKVKESLTAVLPDSDPDNLEKVELPGGVSETVTGVYKDAANGCFAVTVSTRSNYSQGDLAFTIGVASDGKIIKINVTNYQETKPVGNDYFASFVNKDAALEGIDTVAGVTYSSTAIKSAVADVFDAIELIKEAE